MIAQNGVGFGNCEWMLIVAKRLLCVQTFDEAATLGWIAVAQAGASHELCECIAAAFLHFLRVFGIVVSH